MKNKGGGVKIKKTLSSVLIMLLVAIGAGIFTLGIRPSVRLFTDAAGSELPNSIAVLRDLEINGMKQWVSIRGRDRDNPVLLWLHGGPGSAQISMSHYLDKELEERYVVVHWDQRGAGKSNHSGLKEETMTVQQFKDDTVALISYIKEYLGQEKIYLLGHSWGTQLGIELAYEFPEKFHGYIAVSQVVNHSRAVEIASAWLRQEMKNSNDQEGLKKLEDLKNPAHYHKDYRELAQLVSSYGGNYEESILGLAKISFRAPEYNFIDYYRLLGGMIRGGTPIHRDGIFAQYNYIESIPELEIPIYFFIGSKDYNTPFQLVEEYYIKIVAPYKKLVIFEDSGHTPFITENEKFIQELIAVHQGRGSAGAPGTDPGAPVAKIPGWPFWCLNL